MVAKSRKMLFFCFCCRTFAILFLLSSVTSPAEATRTSNYVFSQKNLLLFPAICSLSVSFFQHFHSHFFVLFFPFPSFSFLLFLPIITASFVFPPSPFFSCPKILQNLLLLCPVFDLALLHSFFFWGVRQKFIYFPPHPPEKKRKEKKNQFLPSRPFKQEIHQFLLPSFPLNSSD